VNKNNIFCKCCATNKRSVGCVLENKYSVLKEEKTSHSKKLEKGKHNNFRDLTNLRVDSVPNTAICGKYRELLDFLRDIKRKIGVLIFCTLFPVGYI
jgi:hypothetical protein